MATQTVCLAIAFEESGWHIWRNKMKTRLWFSVFALSGFFLTTWAQACGTRNNGDGTITVLRTGLQYQACPLGTRSVRTEIYFNTVFDACESISRSPSQEVISASTSQGAIARYSIGEWRLITPEEAKSILPDITECQPLNTWTSERDVGFTNRGGSTNFTRFGLNNYPGGDARTVQLVRSTKPSGSTTTSVHNAKPSPSTASNLDTAERRQASQANQQPAQEQTKQAQQQSQQAQQTAQQNQARADQERQGKRKTHDPAAEAHECISIDKASSGNFGAFKNQCPYPVNFTTCNNKPKTIQGGFNWSADFDCAKQQFGLHTPKANSSVAAHNRNTEYVYWFACKAPAGPVDGTWSASKGIEARCY
jgi:hypothetical protein